MRRALLLVLLASCARWGHKYGEDARKAQGGAYMHYELTSATKVDAYDSPRDLVLAGAKLHGFVSLNKSIAFHGGIDLALGSTLRGAGLAYDVAGFPLGVAVRFGRTSFLALGAGIGGMGGMGTLDDAVTFPVEATLEVGNSWRLLARVRTSWVEAAPGRHDGAPSVPWADELDGMVGLRFGHHYEDYGFPSGNGYFVGVTYRELLGDHWVGGAIGYSIDLGTPR